MSEQDEDDADAEIEVEEEGSLPEVAQSEHDIIMMARALVSGPDSNDDIWSLLCASRNVAPKIGTTCARLLEDTLRQSWRALWQRGGSAPKMSHTGQRGRLWERYQPTPLAFSGATVSFLRWLVTTPFSAPASTIKAISAQPLEMGDQLLVYFALDAARATPALRVIASQPFVQAAPLAWLGFANYLGATAEARTRIPAFDSLVTVPGAIVVEALSDELARRWQSSDIAKRSMTDPDELVALGAAQDGVLTRFFDACDAHKRRDLATFVLDAVYPLITRNVIPAPGQLDPSAPLSLRANARTSAGSLLRALMRWNEWDQQHRGVRFIDDDYQSAQLLLNRFERIGSAGVDRVQGWLVDLAALAPTAAPAEAGDTVPAGQS